MRIKHSLLILLTLQAPVYAGYKLGYCGLDTSNKIIYTGGYDLEGNEVNNCDNPKQIKFRTGRIPILIDIGFSKANITAIKNLISIQNQSLTNVHYVYRGIAATPPANYRGVFIRKRPLKDGPTIAGIKLKRYTITDTELIVHRCDALVPNFSDTTYTAIVSLHELGHCEGQAHGNDPDSYMNPRIRNTEPYQSVTVEDLETLESIYE